MATRPTYSSPPSADTTVTPSISIIIPVLNEELEIGAILSTAVKQLEHRGGDWEIIVVDNASTDDTCAVVEQVADGQSVRLLRNEVNRGKGYSIRRGMLESNCKIRLMCDADCVSSLSSLPSMEAALDDADIVVGSRLARGSHVSRQQPIRRRIVGFGFLLLTRLLLGRLARDVYCGFKLWTADAAVSVFSQVHLDGWVFDAEALALGKRLGFRISEVGIDWTDRPNSRLSIRTVLIPVITELYSARRNVRSARQRSNLALDP
jgi:dolichyl-phosphate beta-glucosyltransferase